MTDREKVPDSKSATNNANNDHNCAQRIDFMSFIASLATNAFAALGVISDEQAKDLPRDQQLAAEYIDILIMLQEKTQGNLNAAEENTLEQIIADLQMQYVQSTCDS
ncbi:MAG: DUF1844 domain-containing protein [Deltaproteobacteria bacterium]|nr:DUF1844 domain-containing protein [Deltaproteobacteria bacterium]